MKQKSKYLGSIDGKNPIKKKSTKNTGRGRAPNKNGKAPIKSNGLIRNLLIILGISIIHKKGENYDPESENYESFIWGVIKKGEKRVHAIQQEVEKRRKQREIIKIREAALNRREEILSQRFNELKRREDEFRLIESYLRKLIEEFKEKEEKFKKMEQRILGEVEQNDDPGVAGEKIDKVDKEEWLSEQRKLQAELLKMRAEVVESKQSEQMQKREDEKLKKMEKYLRLRQKEVVEFKKQMEQLISIIIEKDVQIESLKGDKPNFMADRETREILKVLDDLLGNLPEEVVDRFAKSNNYVLYEKVLEKYEI